MSEMNCGILNIEKRILEILSIELIAYTGNAKIKLLKRCVDTVLNIAHNEKMAVAMDENYVVNKKAGNIEKAAEYANLAQLFNNECVRARQELERRMFELEAMPIGAAAPKGPLSSPPPEARRA